MKLLNKITTCHQNVVLRTFAMLMCVVIALTSSLKAEDESNAQFVTEVEADALLGIKAAASAPALVLTYNNTSQETSVYEVHNDKLKLKARKKFAGVPQQAIRTDDGGLLIALGYGRGALKAPITLVKTDVDLEDEEEMFRFDSPRSQINYLKEIGDKIWINYFDSKYFTVRGNFGARDNAPWSLQGTARERLATSIAVMPPFLAVGRPYGDKIGEDGDARLEIGKEVYQLPTLRGVSSIALLPPGGRKYPKVLAGDGWHQNYGKIAKGRLTMFSFDSNSKAYKAEVIDTDPEQFHIVKINPLLHDRKLLILAGGNKSLNIYDSTKKWKRERVFTSENENVVFDFALLSKESDSITVAVFDGKIKIKRVGL